MVKIFFSNETKSKLVEEAWKLPRNIKKTADKYGVSSAQLRRWKEKLPDLLLAPKAKTVHKGRPSSGEHLISVLTGCIEDSIQKSLPITVQNLVTKVLELDPTFLLKEEMGEEDVYSKRHKTCIEQWIRRFLDSSGYTNRAPTHTAQQAELSLDVLDGFLNFVSSLCTRYNITANQLFNMDQTSIDFAPKSKKTITHKGAKTVNVRVNKVTGGGRASLNLCVNQAGVKLPAYAIFKGVPGSRIDSREVPGINNVSPELFKCTVQESAWCDEEAMLRWIKEIWKPHVDSFPQKKLFVLMLDAFTVHKCARVKQALSDVQTIVVHLPPGATYKLQVLDVGVNAPFKQYFLSETQQFLAQNPEKKVGRQEVCEFIRSAWTRITPETIRNTFRHIGFTNVVETESQ